MIDLSGIQIEKAARRTMAIQIKPDGTIVVKAPRFTPTFLVHQFVRLHADWIEKHLQKMGDRPRKPVRRYEDGEEFLYLGTPHVLSIGAHPQIEARDGKLHYPEFLRFRITKELPGWYRKEAERIITARVAHNAALMGVSYSEIFFSDTKSKWGSCTFDNRLQFNIRLVMAPLLVLNYVVIHELAHITEKNHSRAFWKRVEAFNPSYRQQLKWLKANGHALVL